MNYRVNEQIKAPRVQVIGPDGRNLGVMGIKEALSLADEYGLDLVEVAPNASPPVVRIMDYGKFLYQQKKKEKQKSKTPTMREIEMSPNIGEHDLMVKVKKIREFLEKGNKVLIEIRMKGRQALYSHLAEDLAKRVIDMLGDISTPERDPVVEDKRVYFILKPKGNK
ncbi:MAG: translation initiation factor IF-3 [candidate division WOR-3 bacterium]